MIVCECCEEEISRYKWSETKDGYYRRGTSKAERFLHRFVLSLHGVDIPHGYEVDHIDQNPGNNCIDNLRVVPHRINALNRKNRFKNNTSGFRGVSKRPNEIFQASIRVNGKLLYLGRFKTDIEAAKAYNDAAILHFGDLAVLNEV